MKFLDNRYLLETKIAEELFERVKSLPILDLHSHVDVKEVLEDKSPKDIWEIVGATDHYVWELMRRRGVSEDKITGDASNKEKWFALAEVFPSFAGNPTYEWIHLDLKRRFGIKKLISKETAMEIWEEASSILKRGDLSPRRLLKEMKVELMCTTDDTIDDLKNHEMIKKEMDSPIILPTWRADKAIEIEKKDKWKNYIERLGEITKENTSRISGLISALEKRQRYFKEHGCISCDFGLERPYSFPVREKEVSLIYDKAYRGMELTQEEVSKFKAFMLYEIGKINKDAGWFIQLHIGALRNYRGKLYKTLGADSGGDISTQNIDFAEGLRYFLNEFEDLIIVLYCLDPTHLPTITTIARAFPNVMIGAPWWFNDSPFGIEFHLNYTSSVDLLANCLGMVSDSRKLLSYGSRIEVFRRTLCNVVGKMVERGQIPFEVALRIVEDVSYLNTKRLVKL
ncbi:MAG: glucuronate isomerase [candidate division WOR-3 bacterium]